MNLFNKKTLIARTESYKSQLSSQNKADKAELRSWFNNKKIEILAIKNEEHGENNQIDREVYRFYRLGDEEIEIIENI
jgi:hypothetical protein